MIVLQFLLKPLAKQRLQQINRTRTKIQEATALKLKKTAFTRRQKEPTLENKI